MIEIKNISQETTREFERVFNLFDANGDETLTREEIEQAIF